jgi:hypothetical protein
MRKSGDYEGIEMSRFPKESGIIKTEKSAPGTLLRPFLRPIFVNTSHDFFNNQVRIEGFSAGTAIRPPIRESEK